MPVLEVRFRSADRFDKWGHTSDDSRSYRQWNWERKDLAPQHYGYRREEGSTEDSPEYMELGRTLAENEVANVLMVLMGRRPVGRFNRWVSPEFPDDVCKAVDGTRVVVENVPYPATFVAQKTLDNSYTKSTQRIPVHGKLVAVDATPAFFTWKVCELFVFTGDLRGNALSARQELINAWTSAKAEFLARNPMGTAREFFTYLAENPGDPLVRVLAEVAENAGRSGITNWIRQIRTGDKPIDLSMSMRSTAVSHLYRTEYADNPGKTRVRTLSGVMYIPVTATMLTLIGKHGKLACTVLEGGLAYVEDIHYVTPVMPENARPVYRHREVR